MDTSILSQADSIISQVDDNDPDYCPDEEQPESEHDVVNPSKQERCLLVYESTLLNLFKHCLKCGAHATAKEINIKGPLFKGLIVAKDAVLYGIHSL